MYLKKFKGGASAPLDPPGSAYGFIRQHLSRPNQFACDRHSSYLTLLAFAVVGFCIFGRSFCILYLIPSEVSNLRQWHLCNQPSLGKRPVLTPILSLPSSKVERRLKHFWRLWRLKPNYRHSLVYMFDIIRSSSSYFLFLIAVFVSFVSFFSPCEINNIYKALIKQFGANSMKKNAISHSVFQWGLPQCFWVKFLLRFSRSLYYNLWKKIARKPLALSSWSHVRNNINWIKHPAHCIVLWFYCNSFPQINPKHVHLFKTKLQTKIW